LIRKYIPHIALIVLCVLAINQRIHILEQFNYVYTDDDQTVVWMAAQDIAKGQFHTPFFYGQLYNNMLSAWLAVPMLWLNISPQVAVPIASNAIGFVPIVFIVFLLIRKKSISAAVVALSIWLLIPIDYQLVGSMARGFSGGLAILSVGIFFWFASKKRLGQNVGLLLMGFSPIVNPNVLLLLLPILLVSLLNGRFAPRKWMSFGFGLILVAATHLLSFIYKKSHIDSVVYKLRSMELTFEIWQKGLNNIDIQLAHVFPLAFNGWITILGLVISIILIYVYRRKSPWSLALLATLFVVILSLGLNKAADGSSNLFFPYSRMYLGLPLVLILAMGFTMRRLKHILLLLPIVGVGVAGYYFNTGNIEERVQLGVKNNEGKVEVTTVEMLCYRCEVLNQLVDDLDVEIVVFFNKTAKYNYGCSVVLDSFVSIHPSYDRRIWEYRDKMTTVYNRILWLDWDLSLDTVLNKTKGALSKVEDVSFPAWIHTENTQSLEDIYLQNNLVLPFERIKE